MRNALRSVRAGSLVLTVLLAAGLLSGCGGDAGKDAAGAGPFPVSIPNVYGKAVIEKQPKRVVSIGYRNHDVLLALGIKPVAFQGWIPEYEDGLGPWSESKVKGAKPKVFPSTQAELNVGKLAKLKPDLIVGTDRAVDKQQYELLSKLAPTVIRTKQYQDFQMPWDKETLTIGKAVGKEAEAKRLIAKTRDAFAKQRKAHPQFRGKSIAVAYPLKNGGLGVYSSQDQRSQFFSSLGFRVPESIDDLTGDQFYKDLSPERLDLIGDVDLLVVIDFNFPEDFYDDKELYNDLEVVRQGRAIYPLPYTNAVSFNTVLSIPYCLDKVTPVLVDTLNGK